MAAQGKEWTGPAQGIAVCGPREFAPNYQRSKIPFCIWGLIFLIYQIRTNSCASDRVTVLWPVATLPTIVMKADLITEPTIAASSSALVEERSGLRETRLGCRETDCHAQSPTQILRHHVGRTSTSVRSYAHGDILTTPAPSLPSQSQSEHEIHRPSALVKERSSLCKLIASMSPHNPRLVDLATRPSRTSASAARN
jgi:hypothetical protein